MKNLEFVYTSLFNRYWIRNGLTQQDKKTLEDQFVAFRQQTPLNQAFWFPGTVVKGTGGAMKFRFASEKDNRGKSGSYRLLYVVVRKNTVYFLTMYAKSQRENLSDYEKIILKKAIKKLR